MQASTHHFVYHWMSHLASFHIAHVDTLVLIERNSLSPGGNLYLDRGDILARTADHPPITRTSLNALFDRKSKGKSQERHCCTSMTNIQISSNYSKTSIHKNNNIHHLFLVVNGRCHTHKYTHAKEPSHFTAIPVVTCMTIFRVSGRRPISWPGLKQTKNKSMDIPRWRP